MVKKAIQRKRTMRYFIDAAKEIIKEEGIETLTARGVGERSGYSYATIYNYFNDLDTLLVYCIFDFLEDCYEYMKNLKINVENSKEEFISYSVAYFKYFVDRPNMFHLIFVKGIKEVPEELMSDDKKPSIAILIRDILVDCAKEGYISEQEIDLLGELVTSSIHGKLLFFLKGRQKESLESVVSMLEREIRFLIQNRDEKY